jgi:hypothetical protein
MRARFEELLSVHDLRGVRLGALERTLLTQAPRVERFGLLIDAPERTRSAQQGYLRAAKKLERHDLLRRARLKEGSRCRDRRRERPIYRRGQFWLPRDPTRRQILGRVAVWATPFGEAVRTIYSRELHNGLPIRWTAAKLVRAERLGDAVHRDTWEHEAVMNTMEDGFLAGADSDNPDLEETYPEDVETPDDLARWWVATRAVARAHPRAGSAALWAKTCRVYRSDEPLETLKAKGDVREDWVPKRSPLRFTRGELGAIMPTDPQVARDSVGRDRAEVETETVLIEPTELGWTDADPGP